jgi:leucyl-tRNA---protein transferase
MREHHRSIDPPRPCAYLPAETARLEQRVLSDVAPAEWDAMLARGWRRFGPVYFRPACAPCGECVSLRIPVPGFRPSESQRRARKALGGFQLRTGPATATQEKVDLYRRWHAAREEKRDWEPSPLDLESYALQFGYPAPCARELLAYDGDRLVLVGLFDQTPRSLSAVYCFYDPDIARQSPGVANVVWSVEHAAGLGLDHVYLGYRVLGCPSLAYKDRYRPHELLEGRPAPTSTPDWRPAAP